VDEEKEEKKEKELRLCKSRDPYLAGGEERNQSKKKMAEAQRLHSDLYATRQLPEGHGAEGAVTKKTQPPALEAALKPVRLAMEEQHLLEVPLLVVRCWSWNWNYRRRNGNTVSKLRLLK
jgi:hypothetical protein